MPSYKEGHSPAQKLFGYPIQDLLPAHLVTEWQKSIQEAEQQATETLEQSTSSLPNIRIGSPVALQSQQTKLWDVYGTVVAIGPHRRYYVKTHSGRVLVCNRRFLRHRIPALLQPLAPVCHPSTPNQHTSHQQLLHPYQHLQNLPSIHATPCDPTGHSQGLWKILTGHNFSIGAHFNTPMLGGRCRKLN